MKARIWIAALLVLSLLLTLMPVLSAAADGGYDEWGYNYTAHIFNGGYCDAYQGAAWCQPYAEDHLIMKWNDAWLSKDKIRHEGFPSYIGSGAWLTNHQRGSYIGGDGLRHEWDYFVKIVAMPSAGYDCAPGYAIWGEFCAVQSVYNDPYGGYEGVEWQPADPGLGSW